MVPPPHDVFLHVGMIKTGTTYLQALLRAHGSALQEQGLSVVPERRTDNRLLAAAIRDAFDPRADPPRGANALERFPAMMRRAGTPSVLYSAETLAGGAKPAHIARLGEVLGDRRVHVVLTVRDLGRAVPSVWQQFVRGGSTRTFSEVVEAAAAGPGDGGHFFWRGQDVLSVMERWSALAPPERCHIVAVPQRGAPKDELFRRFCSVLGVDPDLMPPEPDLPPDQVNASIGLAQTEVLRQINALLPPEVERRDLRQRFIKQQLGYRALALQPGAPPRVPREYADVFRARAAEFIEGITSAGYQVTGDPADLMPADDSFTDVAPTAEDSEVATAAVHAMASMLTEQMSEFAEEKRRRRSGDGTAGARQ